jgi:hypothetical protein
MARIHRARPAAVLVALAAGLAFPSAAAAQTGPAGPVVHKNATGSELTITNLRYVDARGDTHTVAGEWKLKPGDYGYLRDGPNKIVAKKITYDLVTADGKTVDWSCSSTGLDKDGDFPSQFTPDNLATHRKLLGKGDAVKPAAPAPPAGPTDEQIGRGVLKALGVALLHQKASEPWDGTLPHKFGIELARTGRDKLITSAVDDLFPQLPAKDRGTLGRLVPLALDGRLTAANLKAAEARDAITDYLRTQNPDFALAAQAADFLYRVQQGAR